jgi:uncharacterized protein (TIGR01777 family)
VNIVIAGGTGFLGSTLVRVLGQRGHKVSVLSRRPSAPRSTPALYHWDPVRDELDPNALDGAHAVVNLSGESLAAGRWTPERKRRLLVSRVDPTRFLVRRWTERAPGPRVLVNASAVGIYGDRGEEVLTEESAPGVGFLADLCREWEAAALGARDHGVRVVLPRFAPVLDPPGGLLPPMLPLFRLGLGGPLGSGRQWMSWVSLADASHAVAEALEREEITGPVNVAAPQPVRNRDFARALGKVLRRPAFLPAPAPALRLLLGAMADEALLTSARVIPARLSALGYRFAFDDLEGALRNALRR